MLLPYRAAPSSYVPQPRQSAARDRAVPRAPVVAMLILTLCTMVSALVVGATMVATQRARPALAAAGGGVADWTVLVYMAGDNNLEAAALNDLREITQVGSSAQLTIVAQVDRIAAPNLWDDTTAGDWAGTR
ncbi:MAG: hypothetical protein HGA45_29655, partial [Chloroflexales bacterium]|nr:hypothetical protein [Chloroflexales bacterium]